MADKNAPAFPTWEFQPLPFGGGRHVLSGGISRREYFAAAALNQVGTVVPIGTTPEDFAKECFAIADAMIAESQKGDTP